MRLPLATMERLSRIKAVDNPMMLGADKAHGRNQQCPTDTVYEGAYSPMGVQFRVKKIAWHLKPLPVIALLSCDTARHPENASRHNDGKPHNVDQLVSLNEAIAFFLVGVSFLSCPLIRADDVIIYYLPQNIRDFSSPAVSACMPPASTPSSGYRKPCVWTLDTDNIGVSVLCPGFVNSKIYDCYTVRPEAMGQFRVSNR